MKGLRRKAREDALQVLFQLDVNSDLTPSFALVYFQDHFSDPEGVDGFTQRLVLGVADNLEALDKVIVTFSEHWRMERMSVVDRNLLRLGCYELEYCDDIPATVSINEMIELAKEYGTENSPAFINGILDKVRLGLHRPNKAP